MLEQAPLTLIINHKNPNLQKGSLGKKIHLIADRFRSISEINNSKMYYSYNECHKLCIDFIDSLVDVISIYTNINYENYSVFRKQTKFDLF